MTAIVLTKAAGGALVPVDQQAVEFLQKLKLGAGVTVEIKRNNNVAFHRKLFALANYAFECWEPGEKEYKGQQVEKQFDQFREDITILAGFYETRVRLDGTIRLIAKSWSFSSMNDAEKDRLYNSIINAVLKHIMRDMQRSDLDRIVDQLLSFT
ncbi:DUF1367 family protein [Massilia atriviolacea]|uniref:DUF1367 family protein n=1 Tax=Massilia atriviolacea TaxID=2495579 RepID=A0A430HR60_9BURK|nr:DUF1367 family protein [Massilia atriviolacea]RSZ60007.1 DUF1367 family protein [Massilia atriviolacea]